MKMSFKIVQTEEPGQHKPSLCIVPTAWENNGVLQWPNTKKLGLLNKLVHDAHSIPEVDWMKQSCRNKRSNILSYEKALAEMDSMVERSDSDSLMRTPPKKRMKTAAARKQIGRSPQINFNEQMEQHRKQEYSIIVGSKEMEEFQQISYTPKQFQLTQPNESATSSRPQLIQFQQQMLSTQKQQPPIFVYKNYNEAGTSYATNITHEDEFQETEPEFNLGDLINIRQPPETVDDNPPMKTIEQILTNQNSLLANQQNLLSNQLKIMEHLAKNNAMLDLLLTRLDNNNLTADTNAMFNDELVSNLLPIDSFEKLEKMELAMKDEMHLQQLVERKSAICGTSGKMIGINCCYTLIDGFFSREFLKKFSWGGGSRETNAKSCFKNYKNIIKAFYLTIRKADMAFSEVACEVFFKSIVKNAKRRASLFAAGEQKCRASTGERRPSHLTYSKKIMVETNIDTDGNIINENIENANNRDIDNAENSVGLAEELQEKSNNLEMESEIPEESL